MTNRYPPTPKPVSTPLPPHPSFVSLAGAYRPAILDQADRQLNALLDTHRWIQVQRSNTIPDTSNIDLETTIPD